MAHKRIRKFNTSDTYPEQNLDNDLCQAVVTEGGKTVWLRGQCPQNLDNAINITSNDPVEQTHKVMQNIKQLIEEAGGEMEHLVKVVVYITDVRHREAVYRTMGQYIKGVHVNTGSTSTSTHAVCGRAISLSRLSAVRAESHRCVRGCAVRGWRWGG